MGSAGRPGAHRHAHYLHGTEYVTETALPKVSLQVRDRVLYLLAGDR